MFRLRAVFLIVLSVLAMAHPIAQTKAAQKPTATTAAQEPVKADSAPTFTDDDIASFRLLRTVWHLANSDCQVLESMKLYQQQVGQWLEHIEKKYPGWTVDMNRGVFAAKAPAAASVK